LKEKKFTFEALMGLPVLVLWSSEFKTYELDSLWWGVWLGRHI